MILVERPGYRINSRTIKRGSRSSILIVSFVESSNLCILAIIFIGFLFGSYRGVVLVLFVLVMTRLSSPKTVFICVFYCVFGIGDFAGSSVRKVSFFHLFAKSPLLVCYISKGSICRPRSNKIGFTLFGLHLQKILQFLFGYRGLSFIDHFICASFFVDVYLQWCVYLETYTYEREVTF